MSEVRGVCPYCGSERVMSADLIYANAYISEFTFGKNGEPEPEWTGDTEVCWDSQSAEDPERPYVCRDCWVTFPTPRMMGAEIVVYREGG